MEHAVLIALENQIKKQITKTKAKDLIKPGNYQINRTIVFQVKGNVRKGEETEFTPTVAIPIKAAMALLLEKSGITREHSSRLLVEAMTEAINLGKQGEDFVKEKINVIEEAEKKVKETIDALPKAKKKGITTVSATVDEVAVEPSGELVLTNEIIYSSLDEEVTKPKKKKK